MAPGPSDRAHLERFSLCRRLYQGRISSIFAAVDKVTGFKYALKIYRKRIMNVLERGQLDREIRVQRQLSHTHICCLHATFEDERAVYLVLDHAAGGDLFEALDQAGGKMDERRAKEQVIRPLLLALEHAHGKGIIHRDIKPENLLLGGDGSLMLADWGLAIDQHAERPASRLGTWHAMAPEVHLCPFKIDQKLPPTPSDPTYSAAVDIWSAGILACELLLGEPPFVEQGRDTTYESIVHQQLVLPPSLSTDACEFIHAALCKDAQRRPTASQLLQHRWLSDASPQARSRSSSALFGPLLPDSPTRGAPSPPPSPLWLAGSPKSSANSDALFAPTRAVRSATADDTAAWWQGQPGGLALEAVTFSPAPSAGQGTASYPEPLPSSLVGLVADKAPLQMRAKTPVPPPGGGRGGGSRASDVLLSPLASDAVSPSFSPQGTPGSGGSGGGSSGGGGGSPFAETPAARVTSFASSVGGGEAGGPGSPPAGGYQGGRRLQLQGLSFQGKSCPQLQLVQQPAPGTVPLPGAVAPPAAAAQQQEARRALLPPGTGPHFPVTAAGRASPAASWDGRVIANLSATAISAISAAAAAAAAVAAAPTGRKLLPSLADSLTSRGGGGQQQQQQQQQQQAGAAATTAATSSWPSLLEPVPRTHSCPDGLTLRGREGASPASPSPEPAAVVPATGPCVPRPPPSEARSGEGGDGQRGCSHVPAPPAAAEPGPAHGTPQRSPSRRFMRTASRLQLAGGLASGTDSG